MKHESRRDGKSAEVRLRFDEYGEANRPVLMMLHGAGTLDTFCHQYALARRYRLIVPHLAGAGDAAGQVYEAEAMVRAVLALMDELQLERVGLIGHSLGAQLAVQLACARPERFAFAVFLSAWVDPTPRSLAPYLRLAPLCAGMMRQSWLVRLQARYWGLSPAQAERMCLDARRISTEVWASFFQSTLDLKALPAYRHLELDMLAVCGSRETRDMRRSLDLLGENPRCQTLLLSRAGHDFPLRAAARINPILEDFIRARLP